MVWRDSLKVYIVSKLKGQGLGGWDVSIQPLIASAAFIVVLSKGSFAETRRLNTDAIAFPKSDEPYLEMYSRTWDQVQALMINEIFERDVLVVSLDA